MKSLILQNNKLVKVAAIATLFSMLLWTVGLQNARGAGITSFSNTLSDSAPSATSQHVFAYTSATAVAAGETIRFSFSDDWDLSAGFTDADVSATGMTVNDACDGGGGDEVSVTSSNVSPKHVTLTVCAGDTVTAGAKTVTIGDGAVGGINDIINPSVPGTQEIDLGGTQTDSGSTRVFIIDDISMTATVDTIFNFYINGRNNTTDATANGEAATVNGGAINDITTTPTTIPWGEITASTGTTGYAASHTLSVGTNATNGFVVTLEQDQDFTSSANDIIDLFIDGAGTATPAAWQAPAGTLGTVTTYGHWGITSEDSDLNGDEFGSALYAANLNAPRQVFSHTGPADGQSDGTGTADIGATNVGYKIQITELQEAGDYQNTLTYIATPTF